MAYADDLVTARDRAAARLAEALSSAQPNYSIDGQSVSRGDYLRQLHETINNLNDLIDRASGPVEEHSVAFG